MQFKIIGIFIALMAIVLACGNEAPPGSSSSKSKTASNPGKKVYRQYCVTCHGVGGDMQLNGAKDFRLSELSLEERVLVITNGRRLMTPFKGMLSEKEIREVAAYTMEYRGE